MNRLFGLPKIHGNIILLRPEVPCINIPIYISTKFFDEILTLALPKPKSYVNDLFYFEKNMKKKEFVIITY